MCGIYSYFAGATLFVQDSLRVQGSPKEHNQSFMVVNVGDPLTSLMAFWGIPFRFMVIPTSVCRVEQEF